MYAAADSVYSALLYDLVLAGECGPAAPKVRLGAGRSEGEDRGLVCREVVEGARREASRLLLVPVAPTKSGSIRTLPRLDAGELLMPPT